jgi:hypothetical protein
VEDWRHRWYSGDVLLGKSLNEAFWWVGWQDDRGFLTVAGSRSGIPCSMRTQAQSCGMI